MKRRDTFRKSSVRIKKADKMIVLSLIRLFFGLFISHLILFYFLCVIATRGWQFVVRLEGNRT